MRRTPIGEEDDSDTAEKERGSERVYPLDGLVADEDEEDIIEDDEDDSIGEEKGTGSDLHTRKVSRSLPFLYIDPPSVPLS